MERLSYNDILDELPELMCMLHKRDSMVFSCHICDSTYNAKCAAQLYVCFDYPSGFRTICVLDIMKNSKVLIVAKLSSKIMECCLLWAQRLCSSKSRQIDRSGLIKEELVRRLMLKDFLEI